MRVTEDMVTGIVDAIVREADPDRIYLFGSQVTGDASFDSDMDLLVVQEASFSPDKRRWQEMQRIRKSLRGFRIAKDILLYSRAEFNELKKSPNHVAGHVAQNGRLLYERP